MCIFGWLLLKHKVMMCVFKNRVFPDAFTECGMRMPGVQGERERERGEEREGGRSLAPFL